jgi:hypothetical protein
MFRDQQQRATELEQDNSDLSTKVAELSKLNGVVGSAQETGKRDEEFDLLEKELQNEKEKNKKLKDECFKDKGILMQQEMSEFEQKNADLLFKVGELESKIEEYESQVKRLETFSNDTDVNGKVNKLFSMLHSVQHDSLKSNLEQILTLLKQWNDSVGSSRSSGASGPSTEEVAQLRLDNSDLKKSLKELKQAFVSQLPNPTEEDLGRQRTDGGSSMVAQQLLKKVRIFEEQNNQLKTEKKQMMDNMLQNSKLHMEHVNLLYSVAVERLLA